MFGVGKFSVLSATNSFPSVVVSQPQSSPVRQITRQHHNKRTNDEDWYYNYSRFAYDIFYMLGYIWRIKGRKMKHIYKLLGVHGFTYYRVNKRWVLISNPAEQKDIK